MGVRLELPFKWQEGCWGAGVSLAGQTRLFFVYALKRQGSWCGRTLGVPELGVGAELSLSQEDGELDEIRNEGKGTRRQSSRAKWIQEKGT